MSRLGRTNGPGKATSQRLLKDKHLWFLAFTLKFTSELSTPASAGVRISFGGLPRVTTSLDILCTRPLRTFKAKGTVCGHRTLSKTGRAGRPYALMATVFLFA